MSRFLTNLAARARGTLPRLEPRRPAPFETPIDRPERFDTDMPAPAAFSEFSASAPRATEAASFTGASASNTPDAPLAAAPDDNMAPAAPAPTASAPIISAAAAPATPARRMAAAPTATGNSGPAAQPPASPAYTSAPTPIFATSSEHAGPPPAPARTNPVPAVLAASADATPVSRNTVSLPGTPNGQAPFITTDTNRDTIPNVPNGSVQLATEPPYTALAASLNAADQSHATHSPLALTHEAPAPLLAQVAAAFEQAAHLQDEAKAPHRAESPQAPTVEIHIGTIELVSQAPQVSQPTQAPAPARGVSLDDFLDGANRP